MPTEWVATGVPPSVHPLLTAGLPRRLAELLALRGIDSVEQAEAFLDPSPSQLAPTSLLEDFEAVVDRLAAARAAPVRLIGDYDADGVTATALLAAALEAQGAAVSTRIPRRHDEGYGLQPVHVREAFEAGIPLVVALDSGTNALEAFETAERLGVELIVIDHHLPEGGGPPPGILLVNPRRAGSRFAAVDLTAAGLAMRVAASLFDRLGREIPWEALARVACLGTIADVAPLRGDNRVIAALGLAALPSARSPGLRALLGTAGLQGEVRASDVAFRLAPRLNAAGRLARADDALELLLTRDRERGNELAQILDRHNQQRQTLERQILSRARRLAAPDPDAPAPLLVAWHEEWHRGVVGICAARLARELHRPTLLLALDGDLAVGSGRSVADLPLHELIRPWADRLERFGGHAQAIGLTVRLDRLETLCREWQRAAEAWLPQLSSRRIRFDLDLTLSEVGPELLDQIARLEPCGAGNPEPVFRFVGCHVASPVRSFGKGHLSFDVADEHGGRPRPVVAWRWQERRDSALPGRFDLLAAVEPDTYRGGPRLRLVDLQPRSPVASD